jgi:hypothetical protein
MRAVLLQAAGHDVVTAGRAREAIDRSKVDASNVLVLDIGQPDIGGNELAGRPAPPVSTITWSSRSIRNSCRGSSRLSIRRSLSRPGIPFAPGAVTNARPVPSNA